MENARLFGYLMLGFVAWTAAASRCSAVLVSDAGQLPETLVAPSDDPGWDNFGVRANSSAIYLGDRWVLTAAHLATGDVSFGGVTYTADTSTVVRFSNATDSGLTKNADLLMYQINEDPGLPPLQITRNTPAVASEVLVIGNGLDSEADLRHWDVIKNGGIWTWNETENDSNYSGYRTVSTTVQRWGTNLVENEEAFGREFDRDILTDLQNSDFDTVTFLTEFDSSTELGGNRTIVGGDGNSDTEYESQAVLHDSGGGLFHRVGENWHLAGVVLSVEGHPQQPDVTRYAIFGDLTYYADLATYRSQIEEHFVYGDFDGDLAITASDIDLLTEATLAGEYNPRFDLDRDGELGFGDRRRLVEDALQTFFGDSDFDGQFGTSDFVMVLQSGLYEDDIAGNANWTTGDWNGDFEFDSRDLVVALQSGGFELGPREPLGAVAAAVPEPSSLALVLASALLALVPSRRRA